MFLGAYLVSLGAQQATQPATTEAPEDPLGRQNPRSAVTAFLEACRDRDYQKASQYLDLRQRSASYRAKDGLERAQQLEQILNSDTHFSVLRLSRTAEGDLADDADPNREHVATITQDNQNLVLDLERVVLQAGSPQVWLFSRDTIVAVPSIRTSTTPPAIERYLPPFLVSTQFLATSLWKWFALMLVVLLMVSLSRLLDWLIGSLVKLFTGRIKGIGGVPWLEAIVQPIRLIFCLAIFRIGIEIVAPSAISRLYIGRGVEVILVWSIAWCIVRLVGLFMNHWELRLDTTQQLASRSMLRLGRRTMTVTIVGFAILLILQSWGYNTSTLIAGLGVGGIAVALAAQQTIANVFGGVSLIGDRPIRIGEFGKFGDMQGVVEDIGMRSTRIRTLNRTIVSVPNANFASLNLENYSVRDKILFNQTFQINRSTADDQMRALIEALNKMLSGRRDLELVPTPARLIALASASISLEIFCYVLTPDIDEFYKIQSELLLGINEVFSALSVELA